MSEYRYRETYPGMTGEGPVVVYQYGKRVSEVLEDSNAAFVWLLKHQGQSVEWALQNGGFSVRPAPEAASEPDAASGAEPRR